MSQAEPKRVLIDTDPGVDDALALLLALASPELEIAAITTVAGNAPIGWTTRNALRTLAAAEMLKPPPVFVGCDRPLRRDLVSAAHVHGDDGLGDAPDDREVGEPAGAHAVDAMIEIVSQWPGGVTLIALGPLTNVATAIMRDPTTMALTREIIAMGGAVACPGNVTSVAEYNFYADPEAAQIVLRSGIPIKLAPLDATMQVRLSEQELKRRLAASAQPAAEFIGAILGRYLQFKKSRGVESVCIMHDPLTVGLALDPAFAEFENLVADIETDGTLTTGMLVVDRRERAGSQTAREGIAVAMRVDSRRFLDVFLDRVLGPSPSE